MPMDSTAVQSQQKMLHRPQASDNCNGPRVSFNKDVHVKRIGSRSNESNGYGLSENIPPPPPLPPYTREIPKDLTKEALIKEAEKVIAQSERIKCSVDTPNSLAGIRLQEKHSEDRQFNSLPHRKKKTKPLGRSVSDASQKKPKRSSIFSLFSKRSDPSLNNTADSVSVGESPRNTKRTRKPVGRSKSDVGYNLSDSSGASGRSKSTDRKRIKIPDCDESMTKPKKKSQLSPISENPPGEKYFGFTPDERKPLRSSKSEEKSAPLARSSARNDLDSMLDQENRRPQQQMSQPIPNHSRSLDSLHSSQLPQEKLPLTKGERVDGMVKRLSMERFSPPPHFNSPAFSYTRPSTTDPIVYAQVLRDENGEKTKSRTVSPMNPYRTANLNVQREKSPYRDIFGSDTVDFKSQAHRDISPSHQTISSKFRSEKLKENQSNVNSSPNYLQNNRRLPDLLHRNNSDEDEGLGFEEKKYSFRDEHLAPTKDFSRQSSCEPPIIPNLRPSYGSMEHLANRRKLLESKIHERSFGREPNNNITNNNQKIATSHRIPIELEEDVELIDEIEKKRNRFKERAPERPDRQKPVSTPRKQWTKQPKYYPETNLDDEFLGDQDSLRREQERQRHKYYLEKEMRMASPPTKDRVIDLGYIDQYEKGKLTNNNNIITNHNLNYNKYRPKERQLENERPRNGVVHHQITVESDRRKNVEKTDSGIENDFNRGRDHRSESRSRLRRVISPEDIKSITELFLKRECQHTESLHPSKKKYEFVFRERSIDDGSHFDPRLDKYPELDKSNKGTLTRTSSDDTKKSDSKKFNSLKRVKEIFSLSSKKKQPSPPLSKQPTPPRKEHSSKPSDATIGVQQIDIATRRRLSTPKASPLPKRNLSQKSSKISHSSDVSKEAPPKTSWFKSLERLSRKKSSEPKKPTIKRSNTTLSRPTYQRAQSPSPDPRPLRKGKLRFFGDTDLESLSRAATANGMKRTPLNAGSSQSMQNLRSNRNQRIQNEREHTQNDFRSKYVNDLSESTSENENTVRKSRPTVTMTTSTPNSKYKHRQYHSMEYLEDDSSPKRNMNEFSESSQSGRFNSREREHSLTRNVDRLHRNALRERNGRSSSETRHLPPIGPTKPARDTDRRRALSNERFLESSGTEGDSSQQSVVYLHATTVGHIPQPYVASSRRSSKSREELNSIKTKSSAQSPVQPMTRTVSRSVSMLAPWTPKHISDGYEINYSQTMQNSKKKPSSSLKSSETSRRARSRDDLSSLRTSSTLKTSTLPKQRK